MKTIEIFFSALAFVLSIGGAFATHFFAPIDGYSKQIDVADQTIACKLRKTCSDVEGQVCRASFLEQGEQYNNIQLFKLDATNVCQTVVYEP